MSNRKDVYVVGYRGAGNPVYGKRHLKVSRKECDDSQDYLDPMTIHQAKRGQKKMPCKGARIYKLVDVTDKLIKK